MCAVSIVNGVVTVSSKDTLVSTKSTVQGSVESVLGVTKDSENVSQLKCADNSLVALTEGGAHDVRGNGLNVTADLDEETALIVNSDGNDSNFNLTAGLVMQSFSDESDNNSTYLYALNAVAMLNNASNNKVVVDAQSAQFYTGDESEGNEIDSSLNENFAVLSGKKNHFISHGNSEINISENAEQTKIDGSDSGDDIVNDKAGSTGKTQGRTLYTARNAKGSVKLNWYGLNAIGDIRNLLSSEVNYYGTGNVVFAQDSYKDEKSGTFYNLQDFLYKYGWNSD